MGLDKIFDSKVVCVIIPGDKFNKKIIEIVKKVKNEKICYVTLNKGVDILIESFKKNKINTKNFFFIDGVSKTIFSPKPVEYCNFISSPNALTEISLAIEKCLDSGFSTVFVDSLSIFMIYHNAEVINHFFHNLSNKIRSENNKKLILILSDKDKDSEVFKKIEVIVDKVIELK